MEIKRRLKDVIVKYLELSMVGNFTTKVEDQFGDYIEVRIKEEQGNGSMIRVNILEEGKQVHIPNILITGNLRGEGVGKKLIKLIYAVCKELGYDLFIVDMVNSFFNSLRRRGAYVIDRETVKITEETRLIDSKKRIGSRAFSVEAGENSNTKEEFKPFMHGGLEDLLEQDNKINDILDGTLKDNRETLENYKENEKNLIFVLDPKYVLDIYFDKNDPMSCDEEYCEFFKFLVNENNQVIIRKMNELGIDYEMQQMPQQLSLLCLFDESHLYDYEPIKFKSFKDVKSMIPQRLLPFSINALALAKKKGKLTVVVEPVLEN